MLLFLILTISFFFSYCLGSIVFCTRTVILLLSFFGGIGIRTHNVDRTYNRALPFCRCKKVSRKESPPHPRQKFILPFCRCGSASLFRNDFSTSGQNWDLFKRSFQFKKFSVGIDSGFSLEEVPNTFGQVSCHLGCSLLKIQIKLFN